MADHRHVPLLFFVLLFFCFHSFVLRSLSLVFFLTRFLFHAYFVFQTLVCLSAALSLPRHSWRSDRHGESVGQQPWNKYGWSWVRWARIICFAICLCESVDVITVVLPRPVSPLFVGKAPDSNARLHKNTPCNVCAYSYASYTCSHTIVLRNTTYTVRSPLLPLKATAEPRQRST